MGEKVVVYTAIFSNYDLLRPISLPQGWQAVCFTDSDTISAQGWDMQVIRHSKLSGAMQARHIKTCPHKYIPHHILWQAKRLIWIDANLVYTGKWEDLPKGNWAMLHNLRDCAYQEGRACIQLGKENRDVVSKQLNNMNRRGYPENYGLHATGFMGMLCQKRMYDFGVKWWGEIERGSHRDQLSFNYTQWRRGITFETIPFLHNVQKFKHLK